MRQKDALLTIFACEKKSMHGYQGSVSYIDDGISLNVVHVRVAEAQLSASSLSGADNSSSNCILEGKWAADGDHKLTRSQV